MRRFPSVLLSACLLVSLMILSAPATAGDYYYGDGYRHRYSGNVSYSSSCCYRKVVRHVRTVRYVRVEQERPRYRHSYYDRPYRYGHYDPPYRRGYYDAPRPRYVSDGYYNPVSYYGSAGYSSYAETCSVRRTRVWDGRGGWVWSARRICY